MKNIKWVNLLTIETKMSNEIDFNNPINIFASKQLGKKLRIYIYIYIIEQRIVDDKFYFLARINY